MHNVKILDISKPNRMNYLSTKHRFEIDLDKAAALGILLRTKRKSLELSAQDIADKLLLSLQQVKGLESGELKYFYGAKLYAQAAEKYVRFLKLNEQPTQTLFVNFENDNDAAGEYASPSAQAEHFSNASNKNAYRSTLIGITLVALIVAGLVFFLNAPAPETSTKHQAPAIPQARTEPPVQSASELPVKESSLPKGTIELKFSGASWVQTVDTAGKKQENTYLNGETLALKPATLQALIIGNASAVTAQRGDKTIHLNDYVTPGSKVARLIGPQIRKLGD